METVGLRRKHEKSTNQSLLRLRLGWDVHTLHDILRVLVLQRLHLCEADG